MQIIAQAFSSSRISLAISRTTNCVSSTASSPASARLRPTSSSRYYPMANRTNHPPTRLRDKGESCTSGIRGVSFILREYSPNQWVAYVSVCYYDEEGFQRNSAISVRKHGPKKALRHALKLRRSMGVKKLPTVAQAVEMYEDWFHGVKVPKSRLV